MATDFYMTLPSNASMEMHPDNTLTHYVTHLPQRIDLTGEWECGLAEVQYPHTWYNVTDNDVWFFLNTIDAKDSSRRSKLSCGYYDDPLTLMYHVNKGLPPRRLPPSRLVVPLPHRGRRCGEHDAGVRHPIRLHEHRGVSYSG